MSSSHIRIVSLNCWGLKYVSKHRTERILAIADVLAASSYDIVALQEVWVHADYEHVKLKVSHILPYAKYFNSGALGAGLAFFSRFPIVGVAMHPYSLNGSPYDVTAGDWFVGKGAASIVVAHPLLGQLEVFDTHFFAQGGDTGPEHLRAHRLVNAWELSKLIRQSAALGRYVIAVGDYNSIPSTAPISLLEDHASLTDSWAYTHPDVPNCVPQGMPPLDAVHTFGLTADSPHNSFSSSKSLDEHASRFLGKRLDYIFFRHPDSLTSSSGILFLEPTECNVVFTELVPGKEFSYSDHFGVETTFKIHSKDDNAVPLPSIKPRSLSPATVTSMIQMLTACYRYSRSRSKLYLTEFVACLIFLLGLVISSAWVPLFWIGPVYIFVTIALAWWATTMFYIGFLHGNWVVGAVENAIEELEIFRAGIATN